MTFMVSMRALSTALSASQLSDGHFVSSQVQNPEENKHMTVK